MISLLSPRISIFLDSSEHNVVNICQCTVRPSNNSISDVGYLKEHVMNEMYD
jgi:hypothetical protein